MSRLLIAASLIAAFATSTFAAEQRFAAPPPDVAGARAEPAPPELRQRRVILDRATLRTKLAEQRAANLARFIAYQQGGVFPSNTFDARKLNVWMDADGHLCAAATIINASGQNDLVQKVDEQNNFIRLGTVKQGPLMDWILTSGLTQDEIAAIQEPYMPVYRKLPVVEPKLRSAENVRLIKKYKQVAASIVKNQNKSLDLAVDRLMKRQDLAWQLVNS
ncbi:hypothetical protein BH11MYX3_BH11MYX3_16210 [soil metagenome]